jgi:hypothetical protein
MAINNHLENFAGKPVQVWQPGQTVNPANAIKIGNDVYNGANQGWLAQFDQFLQDPNSRDVTAFIVGEWEDAYDTSCEPIIEAIVAANEKLPNLRALFIGDMTYQECEISWIVQSDMSPLFGSYPELREFGVRGANDLSLGNIRHAHLEKLVVESGGLGAEIVRQVCMSQLPNLRHLELWLGTENYGWDGTLDDVSPLFSGELFPKLEYLGLRDSDIADEIAVAIANAPIMRQLKTLDLSLGTFGDEGAKALLASPYITSLEKLNLSHHYCSEEMIAKLKTLPMEVDVSDPQDPEDDDGEQWRYVAVGE